MVAFARVLHAGRRVVAAAPGTLVVYDGLGIAVGANYNEPEFGQQPYVTVTTEEIDARFVGDDDGPNLTLHLNDATVYDWPAAEPEPRSVETLAREDLMRELVAIVVELRLFAPERRGDLPADMARDLRERGRLLEAALFALHAADDPGEDIVTGVATGFGTPQERAVWAAACERRTALLAGDAEDDWPAF